MTGRPSGWTPRAGVERGHSSHHRPRFGKGTPSTRGWPRSAFLRPTFFSLSSGDALRPAPQLDGQMIEGGPFVGSDSVEVIQAPIDFPSNDDARPALTIPSPQRQSTFTVFASLPKPGTATLEMFDVTGRRVLAQQVSMNRAERRPLRPGDLGSLASGLYLVRMLHEGAAVSGRVVLMR